MTYRQLKEAAWEIDEAAKYLRNLYSCLYIDAWKNIDEGKIEISTRTISFISAMAQLREATLVACQKATRLLDMINDASDETKAAITEFITSKDDVEDNEDEEE